MRKKKGNLMNKLTDEQICAIADTITSEHGYTDLPQVKAAIAFTHKNQPTLQGPLLVAATVAHLKEINVTEEPIGEVSTGEPLPEAAETQEDGPDLSPEQAVQLAKDMCGTTDILGGNAESYPDRPMSTNMDIAKMPESYLVGEVRNLTAENHILLRENRELRMQIEHMRVAGHIPPATSGAGVHVTLSAPAPTFFRYTVTVNDPGKVPAQFLGADGRPDLKMLHEEVNRPDGPKAIPGCLVGRKQ